MTPTNRNFVFLTMLSIVLFLLWSARPNFANCDEAGANRQRCFAEEIDKVLSAKGLDSAFDALVAYSNKDADFATACHGNAHEIGKVAYQLFAKGGEITYTSKMSYCGYGFFHGFVEALLDDTGNLKQAIAFCGSLGSNLKGSVSGGTDACFHGIGHGATDATDPRAWGNLGEMIAPAMELCKQLPKENYADYLCETGAYNSLEILSTDAKYRLKSLTEDPYAFCNSEPRARREGCYTNMIPSVLRLYTDDVGKASGYILPRIIYPDDITIGDFRIDEMVILSLFQEFLRLHLGQADLAAEGMKLCRGFSSDRLRLACIQGLSGGYMKYDTPETAYKNWLSFCEDAALHEDEQHACFGFVLERISLWYDRPHASAICESVPEQYKSYCKIEPK